MADDAASVLAPDAPWTDNSQPLPPNVAAPPQPAPQGGPTDDGAMMNSRGVAEPSAQPQPQPDQPTPGPATQDPEATVGAAHQGVLAKFLHSALDALGGNVTHRVVKDPDGTYSVHLDESTDKEKWGRIAAAVLGGAAHGLAVGQGPGGAARAVAAGFDSGSKQQQQINDQATADAKSKNENLTMKANHAMQDQQLIAASMGNQFQNFKDAKEQADWDLQLQNMSAEMIASPKNPKELAAFSAANPNLMSGHLGTDGSVLIPDPQADGSTRIWRVPPDQAKMKVPIDITYQEKYLDNDGNIQERQQVVPAHTHTGAEIATILKGNSLAGDNTIKTSLTLKNTKKDTDIKQQQADLKAKLQPSEIAKNQATAQAEQSRAGLQDAQTDKIKNGTPGGTPQPVDDPRFPPASNFEAGTEGINPMPKTGYKIPADTQKAARLSRNIQHNGSVIVDIMNRRPDLVGTINSLGTNWQQKIVGTKDPDLAALDGAVDQLAIASAGAHGSRSAQLVEGIHDGVLNHFKNGPDAVKAYTQGQMNSVQTFIDEENNYRHYGDAIGPSAAARAKAVAKAPPATQPAQPTPQPGNNQAVISNGQGGATPPAPTLQQLQSAGVPANAKSYHQLPNGTIEGWFDQQGGWHKLGGK